MIIFVTALTGFLQRINLQPYRLYCRNGRNPFKKGLCSLFIKSLQCLNWFCQGLLTLAYPKMNYDPIAARRQAAASQWAATFLKIPPKKLEQEARHFLQSISDATSRRANVADDKNEVMFTIVICFYHHLDYFKKCLESIALACVHAPEASLEVLIVNDDPSVEATRLRQVLPQMLQKKVRLLCNEKNLGICRSTNIAIKQARGRWILHLDCDDQLVPTVFEVLEKRIKEHPDARFISSRSLDINEEEKILLWRLRAEEPSDLIINNVASHLKVTRKDLHDDLGFFNTDFEGCQDYEFALRTAIHEPLCFIPDYLYQYRWHNKSQTVGQSSRQNLTALRVRQTYLLAIFWMIHGTNNIAWSISGPCAASWEKEVTSSSEKNAEIIFLEAHHPYSEERWKLLLVKAATLFVDRYRTNAFHETISILI